MIRIIQTNTDKFANVCHTGTNPNRALNHRQAIQIKIGHFVECTIRQKIPVNIRDMARQVSNNAWPTQYSRFFCSDSSVS
jgi:hypothetical protein